MRLGSLITATVLAMASGIAGAQSVDYKCFPLFEEAGATPLSSSCRFLASMATGGMGMRHCTSGTLHINAYCSDPCLQSTVDLENSSIGNSPGLAKFISQQKCIAGETCFNKLDLESPAWADAVVPGFLNPLINRNHIWPVVQMDCDEKYDIADFFGVGKDLVQSSCSVKSAALHIVVDLKGALSQHGCGTDNDWAAIEAYILDCIRNSTDYSAAEKAVAAEAVVQARDLIRLTCV